MRHLFDDDAQAVTRLAEIWVIACGGEAVYQLGADVPIVDVASGYARWSQTYDNPGNPLIHLEQPVVWSILDAVAPGAALDAACGTGRHARRLAELGHHVIGVDASPEMPEKARAALPQATFRDGDLSALPLEPASVDLVVCALALEHVADLGRAIAELSRVLRPGGHMVLSGACRSRRTRMGRIRPGRRWRRRRRPRLRSPPRRLPQRISPVPASDPAVP
jgi:SAM-dependent methyltransferase